MWTVILYLADGTESSVGCATRADARMSARWYRTHTEGSRKVVRTRIINPALSM